MVLVGWIAWLVLDAVIRPHSLELDAITVPQALADKGFTTEVVTKRLRDVINAVQEIGGTTMAKDLVKIPGEEPNISVPVAGVASWLRSLLPESWRHEVSGELTLSGTELSIWLHPQVSMRLRLNGQIVVSDAPTDISAIDTLIAQAAFKLVEKTEPFVAASFLYNMGYDEAANDAASRIIASLPPENENVARAYNLKGLIAQDQGNAAEAAAHFAKVPNLAVARVSMGRLHFNKGEMADAVDEYHEAIRLDPKLALAHNDLAAALRRLDPKFAREHNDLSYGWSVIFFDPERALALGKYGDLPPDRSPVEDARAEYLEAIQLDAKLAAPHLELGDILSSRKQLAAAIDEYRAAIRVDLKSAYKYYDLGAALRALAVSPDSAPGKALAPLEVCMALVKTASSALTDSDWIERIKSALKDAQPCFAPASPPSPAAAQSPAVSNSVDEPSPVAKVSGYDQATARAQNKHDAPRPNAAPL